MKYHLPFSSTWLGGQLSFTPILYVLLMLCLVDVSTAQQQQNATIQCAPTEGLFELQFYGRYDNAEFNWVILDRSGLDVAECDDRSLCENQCRYRITDGSNLFPDDRQSTSFQQCLPLLNQRSNSSEDGCYKLVIGNDEGIPRRRFEGNVLYFNASFNSKTIVDDMELPYPTNFFSFGNEGKDSCAKNTGCDDGQSLLELLMFDERERYRIFYNWTDDDDNVNEKNIQNKQELSVYGVNAIGEICPSMSSGIYSYQKTCIATDACLNVTVDVKFVNSIKAVLDGIVHKELDHRGLYRSQSYYDGSFSPLYVLSENFIFPIGARGSCSADIICDVSRGEKLVEIETSTQMLDDNLAWSIVRGNYHAIIGMGNWVGQTITEFEDTFVVSQPGQVYRHLECVVDDESSCVAFRFYPHKNDGESIVYSVWVDGESVIENGIICENSCESDPIVVNLFGKCRRPLSIGAIFGIAVGTPVFIVVCWRVWVRANRPSYEY